MVGIARNLTLDVEAGDPSGSGQDRARALARAVAASDPDSACAVAHCAATAWWQAMVEAQGASSAAIPPLPYAGHLPLLDPGIAAVATALGASLAPRPVDAAAFDIGRLYASLLTEAHRGTNGVFYTPIPLVCRLLDNAEAAGHDWTTGKVIDPSCGAGAFLVEAAFRMVRTLGPADPAIVVAAISARLRGWDLDPFAAWLAQACVEAGLLPQVIASGKRLSPITEARNSLAGWNGHEGSYTLVMGNPAFGKLKDSTAIRTRFRRSLYGHPNLYGLFMDLAVHLTAPQGGIVAYLTPTSYFGGQYFKALRRLMVKEAPPVSIDIVESRDGVFEQVLQEVALSVFHRRSRRRTARCAVLRVKTDGIHIDPAGTLVLPKDPEASWLMPRKSADVPFVARMLSMPGRLSDWGYSVSTGPLVWNRKKSRLHDDPRPGSVPVIWAESVTAQGVFRLKPKRRGHAAFYVPAGPDDPNLVAAPCVLIQRTTSKEQQRRLVSAVLPDMVIAAHGKVAVENHLNMVIAARRKPAVPMTVVAAFFASETADRIIRCINASVAVSASEIEAMPLPSAKAIVAAMAQPDPEAALRALYGVTE